MGSKGDKGEVGDTGAKGETGNEGYPAGLVYNYETGSTAGSGELRLNNQNPLAATQRIDINGTDKYGNNVSNYLASWDNSTTSSTRGFITIIGFDSTTVDWTELGIFEIDQAVTVSSGVYQFNVDGIVGDSSSWLSNGDVCIVQFSRSGDKGAVGEKGAPGADGPIGPKGPIGAGGPKGDKGAPGAAGTVGDTGADGPIGPKGPIGPGGSDGSKGDKGAPGSKGASGSSGETTEFVVTVQNVNGANKYFINGTQTPNLQLIKGFTYKFDQSDSSNSNHPFRLSITSNGSHSGGSQYTDGWITSTTNSPGSSGHIHTFTVPHDAPDVLYYYCTFHSGMGTGGQINSPTTDSDTAAEFVITVQNVSGANKYFIDGVQTSTLQLVKGSTYKFDQSHSSNSNHPFRLSTTSNGSHSGGSEYKDGWTTSTTNNPGQNSHIHTFTVPHDAPDVLYYYCTNHSGMGTGGQVNNRRSDAFPYSDDGIALTIKVVSTNSGNKYYISGEETPVLRLIRGYTYRFDQSDGSNSNHPFRLSTTDNGTHASGTAYLNGWTTSTTNSPGSSGHIHKFTVPDDAPDILYYYCTNHSGMGSTGKFNIEFFQSAITLGTFDYNNFVHFVHRTSNGTGGGSMSGGSMNLRPINTVLTNNWNPACNNKFAYLGGVEYPYAADSSHNNKIIITYTGTYFCRIFAVGIDIAEQQVILINTAGDGTILVNGFSAENAVPSFNFQTMAEGFFTISGANTNGILNTPVTTHVYHWANDPGSTSSSTHGSGTYDMGRPLSAGSASPTPQGDSAEADFDQYGYDTYLSVTIWKVG